ncbi:argininosuccinate lyase [Terriglobus roseus]|uniref:Argininosuccinate lyase n=1 Tax=Terriglobus roseus TaxID=392734 RepID=A0A1H4PA68_9BACT|nr:argininosuccinate lyase [Terriglobus roseus]SEC04134.1 argininosuccinate lyase [Terriglobus roseus]
MRSNDTTGNGGNAESTSKFPADVYRDTVLAHVFADAQRLFLPSLIECDLAHVLMLTKQGILSQEQAAACLRAILSLDLAAISAVRYDGSVEDLFFYVETELAKAAGADNAGRIHTARSRNDLDLTMYRMTLRQRLLDLLGSALALRQTLLGFAQKYRDAIMPAYTHNQPAQPTTLGHFLMAYIEVMERDAERVISCYARVNRSPLGACAISTTGFSIDRHMTEEALGFRGLVTNSYGAIASVDYVAEACSVLATAMLSLGRFTQEMLLWSTAEFGYLRLSEGYVQISSIMPQKRNPVPLEHTRILASRALTESQSVLGSLHNTPFTDMNDGEDSLQPLVALAFADAERSTTLLAGALSEATFSVERMRTRAGTSFLTVTELADTLVRSTGMSFHQAHGIVSRSVRHATSDDNDALALDVHRDVIAAGFDVPYATVQLALDPENFIAVRGIEGGPAKSALEPELQRAASQLERDANWLNAEREYLSAKQSNLMKAAQAQLL